MDFERTSFSRQLLVLLAVLILSASCAITPQPSRPRTVVPNARSSYARDAIDGTESLLQQALVSAHKSIRVPVAKLSEPCWIFLTTTLAADPHYTLSVYADTFSTTTDPALVREMRAVQNVYIQVDLAEGKQVLIWWYAEAPAACVYRAKPQDAWD